MVALMHLSGLLLFGTPMVQHSTLMTHIKASKPNAVVCFLAAQQGRLVSRARLLTMFWDGLPEREGRRALTTTLSRIHQTCGIRIIVSGDAVRYEPDYPLQVDVDLFRQLQTGQTLPLGAPLETPLPDPGCALSAAVSLYRGEFMLDFHVPNCPKFDQWLSEERQFWDNRFIESLTCLMKLEEQAGAWVALAGHARQALAISDNDERFCRSLIRALAMQGDRTGALARYNRFERDLLRTFGVLPEVQTRALRDAIALGTLAG